MPPLCNPNISCFAPYNDVFDLHFLQKFAFSPVLSLKESSGNHMQQIHPTKEAIPFQNFDEMFTPTDQLMQMMFNKDANDTKQLMTNSCIMLNDINPDFTHPTANEKGKAKARMDKKTPFNRKRRKNGDKLYSEPVKKSKKI